MRTASLLVLLLTASLLCAQEAPSAPPPPPQAATEPAPPAPPPEAAPPPPAAQPAPQLGHPLDPADVATLTAPSSTSVPAYARSYGYYHQPYIGGYPAEIPLFGGSRFSRGNWTMPMFSPFGFGHGRNFFVFRHPGFGPPFFTPGGPGFVGFRPHRGGGGRHR
jgi:hypothetical protein